MEMLEARDATSAQEMHAAQRPDVTVIDINLPDVSGFELARRLVVRDPGARLLMFSMNDNSDVRGAGDRMRRARLFQQERRSAGLSHRHSRGVSAAAIRWRRKWPKRLRFCASGPERPEHR